MASSYVQVGYRFYQSAWKVDVKENPPSLGNCPNKAVHPYPPGQRVTILNVQSSEIPVDWTDWRDSSLFFRRQTSWKVKHHLFRTCVVAIGHCTSGGGFIDIIAGRLHGGLIDTSSAQAVREALGACQPSNNRWIMINHRSMTGFGTQNRYVIVPWRVIFREGEVQPLASLKTHLLSPN